MKTFKRPPCFYFTSRTKKSGRGKVALVLN